MAIIIYHTDGTRSLTITDNTVNNDTSLDLPGRGYTGYGTKVNENLLHLLENFANTSEPSGPVIGQLWYDTGAAGGLKVFNGSSFLDAGGLKSGAIRPADAKSAPGDLWVDTTNAQLYLWNGTKWILIGPEYSDGLITGAKPDTITDVSNLEKTVLFLYVAGQPLAILSTENFTPKTALSGYTQIKSGLNISSNVVMNGVAEKANSLLVDGTSVAGNQFLRKDTANITNESLTVRNNQGISVGLDSSMRLEVGGVTGTIKHPSANSNINLSVTTAQGLAKNVLRVSGSEKVGINRNPDVALHVAGNIQTNSGNAGENGDLIIAGDANIGENLDVSGTALFDGLATFGTATATNSFSTETLLPISENSNIGAANNRWNTVYAQTVRADTIEGQFSGSASTAGRWSSPISLQFGGGNSDITSSPIEIDGSDNVVISASVSSSFIVNKSTVSDAAVDDLLLIQRGGQLFKLAYRSIQDALPTIPVGTIMPYGGPTAPVGYHLCDGSQKIISEFEDLYEVIGYNYGSINSVSAGSFKLPDLRGRVPLGVDNMGGSSANRTLDTSADTLGLSNDGKSSELLIQQRNLPEHQHTFESFPEGSNVAVDTFYALNDSVSDTTAVGVSNDLGVQKDPGGTTSAIDRTGKIYRQNINEPVNEAVNIMPPYQTFNYIIYHGVLS